MNLETVKEEAKKAIALHPELKEEINNLVELCEMEIEEGESEQHECHLCLEDIKQLTE